MRLTLITSELLCLDEQLLRNQVYELILIQKKKSKKKKKKKRNLFRSLRLSAVYPDYDLELQNH